MGLIKLDSVAFVAQIRDELNQQMIEAAEPVIQEALADIEKKMRQKVAATVVGMVEHSYRVDVSGGDLRITVKVDK